MLRLLFILSVGFLLSGPVARAGVTRVALSSDDVPGITGAKFGSNLTATMNSAGSVGFISLMSQGTGVITSTNDSGLFYFDGTSVSLLAQEGSGNVPGAAGANFDQFLRVFIDDSEKVLVRANLVTGVGGVTTDNHQGFWKWGSQPASVLVRTGSEGVADVDGASYTNFSSYHFNTTTGAIAIESLITGVIIGTTTNGGIWKHSTAGSSLVVREGITAAPGVASGLYESFGVPFAIDPNQVVFLASLKTNLAVNNSNNLGIWRYNGNAGQLLARTGSGNVPQVAGANFTSFFGPAMNPSGTVTFRARLSTGQQGLWRYGESSGLNLAITGTPTVPGIPSATFSEFSQPLIKDDGSVITLAHMNVGPGGVTSEDNFGLWSFDGSSGQLLLRGGAGNVPGVPGGSFDAFSFFALAGDSIIVEAVLDVGPGDVSEANDVGIWRVPFSGQPELIIREGDELLGKTIEGSLGFPTTGVTDVALRHMSNDSGQFLFRASFSDGESGLFVYSPTASELAPADFNGDGSVDGADLELWQNAYGASPAGDADNDGDTDGRDFLIWQRQYMASSPPQALAVPEPGVSLIVLLVGGMTQVGRRGKNAQPN